MNIQEENLASEEVDKEIDSDPSFAEGYTMGIRIKLIKKMLRTDYHIWNVIPDKMNPTKTMVRLYLERKQRNKTDELVTYSFANESMDKAVKDAERYVAQELEAGTLKDYSKK